MCGCQRCVTEHAQAHPLPTDQMWLGGRMDPRLQRMFLCGTCGNKRCPHATDHRNACTGSNEPGQAGSMNGEINWRAPIEAVHEDGRVVAVTAAAADTGSTHYDIYGHPDVFISRADGWTNTGWRIRNVATTPADARTAPNGGEVGPEVVERLRASHAALLDRIERNQCEHETTHRGGAIWTICDDCGEKWADDRGGFQPYVAPDWLVEARDVARALLPEPVDADLVEARRIAVEQLTAPGQSDTFLGLIADGTNDHYSEVRIALAAIKRGRALEKEAGR